jgi:hypothetical protein
MPRKTKCGRESALGRSERVTVFCNWVCSVTVLTLEATSSKNLGRLLDVLSNTENRRSPHEERKRFEVGGCLYTAEKFSSEPLAGLARWWVRMLSVRLQPLHLAPAKQLIAIYCPYMADSHINLVNNNLRFWRLIGARNINVITFEALAKRKHYGRNRSLSRLPFPPASRSDEHSRDTNPQKNNTGKMCAYRVD